MTNHDVNLEMKNYCSGQLKPAISIRNVYKKYSPSTVLFKGLNMTVYESTIYALLGPSGCGKTTLLQCMVGKSSLDSGTIEINVKKRAEIGFMPQHICLYDRLKISENFHIFGCLFGLTAETIERRMEEYINFLNIPQGDRLVGTLSGGEQRRVSLALTLLHDPKILFLDEPTVGLDPLLSDCIWVRLLEMVQRGKTIIITTHYIQEAEKAHTIGMMRNGILLTERNPSELLQLYDTDNLENVFVKLIEDGDEEKETVSPKQEEKPNLPSFEEDQQLFSAAMFKALYYKNWVTVKREFIFIILLLTLPIAQNGFSKLCIGGRPNRTKIAVMNDEIALSKCASHEYGNRSCFLENQDVPLSCLFLESLRNKSYNLIDYADWDEAVLDLKKSNIAGIVKINKNYSLARAQVLEKGYSASAQEIDESYLQMYINKADMYKSIFLQLDGTLASQNSLAMAVEDCGLNPNLGSIASSLVFEEPVLGDNEGDSYSNPSGITMMCLCSFFLPAVLTGGLIYFESTTGMPYRFSIAGVPIITQLLILSIFIMSIHIIQDLEAAIVMFCVFNQPILGNISVLLLFSFLFGIAGIGFGFFVCSTSDKISYGSFVATGINIVVALTCGFVWPLEGRHELLKKIHWMIPLTYEPQAIRDITLKGFSFWHFDVLKGFASLIIWCIVLHSFAVVQISGKRGAFMKYST